MFSVCENGKNSKTISVWLSRQRRREAARLEIRDSSYVPNAVMAHVAFFSHASCKWNFFEFLSEYILYRFLNYDHKSSGTNPFLSFPPTTPWRNPKVALPVADPSQILLLPLFSLPSVNPSLNAKCVSRQRPTPRRSATISMK